MKSRLIRLAQGCLHVEKMYGQEFNRMYDFLKESQWWDENKLKEYQLENLKSTIINAYENVPYYTKLFNEYGINAYGIQDFSDIEKIPYLTKEIIHENINDLYNKNYPKYKIEYKTTGGSTGIPMGLYQDKFYTRKIEHAFVTHMWSRVGYDKNINNKIVYLRGVHLKGEYEKDGKHLFLNSFLLNNDNYLRYIERIEKFNPDFINGYPSSLYILSNFIIYNNIKVNIPNLKAILLTSENIYDFQREAIEKAFGKRTYSFYGHTERACIGGECEVSRNYHIHSEYGYTELINSEGKHVSKEGELGEIVCTSFINPVMPFIRYKTKDIAVNTLEKCKCGRNYMNIKRVEGRVQDFIFDKKGNVITFICQDEPFWAIKEKIYAYQYIQDSIGEILLNIQPREKLSNEEILTIHKEFNNIFFNIDIDIKIVDNIPIGPNGKFRYLIQNIENNMFK